MYIYICIHDWGCARQFLVRDMSFYVQDMFFQRLTVLCGTIYQNIATYICIYFIYAARIMIAFSRDKKISVVCRAFNSRLHAVHNV